MNEVIATTVILVGVLLGMVANYWVWSWIFAVRRRTRVRRLGRSDDSPPESELNRSVAESSGDRRQNL